MKVLVGVCGGIAAYKAAELVRALQQRGAEVRVAMTQAAEEFVRPLTFAALSGHPVYGSLWQPAEEERGIEHITVAQEIDALVIAPATANMLAKLAHGLADDFIATVYLATQARVIVAPAMNVNMWNHPATQANVRILQERGVRIVAPDSGYLACGMTGGGRLAEIEAIAEAVMASTTPPQPMEPFEMGQPNLRGETVLVTAGGTREPVDAVRFLGNRSSGRMGHAVAEEGAVRGARVLLVTASGLPAQGCEIVRVATAREMRDAVMERLADATVVIMAAAVADFRPAHVANGKIRRGGGLPLELEPTDDGVAEVMARRQAATRVVGFAAETEDVLANGRRKLERKGVDALVVNDVSREGLGFDSGRNAGWWLTADDTVVFEATDKRLMAGRILDCIERLRCVTQAAAGG